MKTRAESLGSLCVSKYTLFAAVLNSRAECALGFPPWWCPLLRYEWQQLVFDWCWSLSNDF